MPPRIQLRLTQPLPPPTTTTLPTYLLPFLHPIQTQTRHASILSRLSNTPGSYSRKIRRGRGPSSGKGKTSGRGHKGQGQKGTIPSHMNGGQTPDDVVAGKSGFKNVLAEDMSPINLDRIQDWINQGRIDPTKPITLRELAATRAVHGIKDGLKLLARGATSLSTPIHVVVSRASQSAIKAVEALGGSVTTRYYTDYAIHRIRQRKTDPYISLRWDQDAIGIETLKVAGAGDAEARVKGMGYEYRLPDPTSRKDLEYYRDLKNRGYLAHTLKGDEGPSLYHKVRDEAAERARKASKKRAKMLKGGGRGVVDNRIW